MITTTFDKEDGVLSIVYDGVVSLKDLEGVVVYCEEHFEMFPGDIKVFFNIAKGVYDFEVSDIAGISVEFDKVIRRFASIKVVVSRSSKNDKLYTEFFHMLSKQDNITFYVFDDDEKEALDCLYERSLKYVVT